MIVIMLGQKYLIRFMLCMPITSNNRHIMTPRKDYGVFFLANQRTGLSGQKPRTVLTIVI